jgi:hypothetical protein
MHQNKDRGLRLLLLLALLARLLVLSGVIGLLLHGLAQLG